MAERSALRAAARFLVFAVAGAVFTGLISSRVLAQNAGGAPPAAPGMPPPPTQQGPLSANDPRNPLHMTAAQQTKWRDTEMKYQPQARAIVQDKSLTQAQKKAKLTSLIKKANTELLAILTPSQRAQQQKLQKAAEARQAKVMQAINNRKLQLQKVSGQLEKSLTAAQKKKLQALETQMKPKFDQIQADPKLNSQQKQDKMTALGKQYMQQRNALLTSSQLALVQQIQKLQTTPLSVSSR
ncbi:MAG TPA: hypothetical protein VFW40_12920 [Capsulimonadaceae bacterium]|nr:hypothetical protein [Capsulimonadaceae bacterium]